MRIIETYFFRIDTYSLEISEDDDGPAISASEAKENDGMCG
jgi:hypothetical protein